MIASGVVPDIIVNSPEPDPSGAILGFLGVLVGALVTAGAQHFLARDTQLNAARSRAAEAAAAAQQYMVAMDHLTAQTLREKQRTRQVVLDNNDLGARADDLYRVGRQAVTMLIASPDKDLVVEARKLHNVMVEMTNAVVPALRAGEYSDARKQFSERAQDLQIALNMVVEMVTARENLRLLFRRRAFLSAADARENLTKQGRASLTARNENIAPLACFLRDRLSERTELLSELMAAADSDALRQELLAQQNVYQAQLETIRHLVIMHRPLETRTGSAAVLRLLAAPYSDHPDHPKG
ncbi:hypothetical protein LJR013_003219 [Pseudarthrobacter oxydans]|uniref:hypothetical protein n=1 Tax=Pseudarthrobacter oxydans TaxID=1671 RepID=UPI003ECD241E